MTRTKLKGVLSHSVDGEASRKSSRDRTEKKRPKSPLKFLTDSTDSIDGICRQCTKGIEDAKDSSIYCDRCKGCIHFKCTDMTKKEYDHVNKTVNSKLIYHCPVCVKEINDGNGEDDRFAQQNARLDNLTEFCQLIMAQNKEILENLKPENQVQKIEDDIQVQLTEVIQNQSEIDEKKNNLIVFNLPEAEESEDGRKEQEEDVTKVKEILSFLDSRLDTSEINVKNMSRMGRRKGKDDKPRAIKLILPNADMKFKAIRNAKKLTDFKTPRIGISFDKTKKEIIEDGILKKLLEDTRTADPTGDYVIFERKVVTRLEATRLRGIRDAKRGNPQTAPAK